MGQLHLVARLVGAQGAVLDVTVLIDEAHSKAAAEAVGDRPGDVAGDLGAFEVEVVDRGQFTLGRGGRARGDDADGAGGRVLAEQRALRTAQDLDAGKVEERSLGLAVLAGVDTIHVEAD